MVYDFIIAGAGVIGGMLARELSRYNISVCILEKENDVSMGASKANSGIVHGGFDPHPGTLKAKMNVEGVDLLYQAAEDLHVPYKKNGSLVVAFSETEAEHLQMLYDRGIENKVEGMSIVSGDEARKIEPNLSEKVVSALVVPSAGIICPYELTIAAVGNAMDNGAELKRNFEISEIIKEDDIFVINSSAKEQVKGRFFINCAGAFSDKIAELAGDGFFKIIPRAGEYLLLDKSEGIRVSHTIFQVPNENGKGILVSPTVDNNLLTGPTATKVDSPDDKNITQKGIDTVIEYAKKSVPSVDFRQVITSFTGVRSSEATGDFIIKYSEKVQGLIHVAAIDSPGLSSCVSIAKYVLEIIKENCSIDMVLKTDWNGCRENPHAFRNMTDEEKSIYIKAHPEYGKIVCRCEKVSEGEIRDAIRRNPIALDIDGVKRRTRSGMGRCQGGFCMPNVMKILAEENGAELQAVTKKGNGSEQLTGRL